MTEYRLRADERVDPDVEATFDWEHEQSGLGMAFVDELRATYGRILAGPKKYRDLRSGIRRASCRRFPYAVYFAIDGDAIVILCVLHARRDPAEWQHRVT